ncbi:MAG TPA: bifunctional phosphopantothenoylcysteine decarboxylase/phosphopantothenate--cysteine ligase CoaBC, partial [Thermoplasmata archaeon]|nr:bifunctional phosphopantothenoylcysteine decarboxylase/phosphopantothenate--cysteine ligase CoaBC [Thermoplasmata archaeon]
MHPSRVIRGRHSSLLAGRRLVVGVSGSIAAVEVVRIIRELIRHGAEVRAVMSPDAARIITPETLQFATGVPPITSLTGDVEHVSLFGPGPERSDLYLIAPATANTLSKIAHGIDDTVVTSCASVALGSGVPVMVAPAMHEAMGRNPAIRENLERLRSFGVAIIEPSAAEGEEKLASPEEIAAEVLRTLARGPWVGRRIVVVGGASREPIDAVRSVTNESSGAMAVSLARQAFFRGAETHLWLGATSVAVPGFLSVERWNGVGDLLALARRRSGRIRHAAVLLVPAALSDYTTRARKGKISSRSHAAVRVDLIRAPKVLSVLRKALPSPGILVGFKLEAGLDPAGLEAAARRLAEEYRL